nr:hypothetical protein [uncultured Desulfobulbus sp.]
MPISRPHPAAKSLSSRQRLLGGSGRFRPGTLLLPGNGHHPLGPGVVHIETATYTFAPFVLGFLVVSASKYIIRAQRDLHAIGIVALALRLAAR